MILAILSVAAAQEEVCLGVLPVAEVDEALVAVDRAMDTLDGDRAARILDEVVDQLRCLGEVPPPATLGALAARLSVVAWFEQDFEEARRWALLARDTTGAFDAGTVAGPERWRADHDALEGTEGRLDGHGLLPPKGGLLVLDGRALIEPVATTATPHLLQALDKKGRVVRTRWIDGTAFPEDVFGPEGTLELPKWWTEPPPVVAVPSEPVPAEPGPSEPVPSEPVPSEPVAAVEPRPDLVFDGEISVVGCPFAPNPQDVHARGRKVRIEGTTWVFREDVDLTAFRDLMRTCGEFRAARRFARWQVSRGSPFSGAGAFRRGFVEALETPEPPGGRRKRH